VLQYVNCGHVRPRLCDEDHVSILDVANLPVGLLRSASFESATVRVKHGSRLLLVSDGYTEAEDHAGNFFGDEGLDRAARCDEIPAMLQMMQSFCAGTPQSDDCTVVQIAYRGR
jgi:sigma-B regulation protein RsbU (phosphoserine phosphatase)